MNKYKIKETDVNMYEYRGYTISGNDRIGMFAYHLTGLSRQRLIIQSRMLRQQ